MTGKPTLRLRQYDTIKKSVTAAAEKSDYVIHWHADAFALDDKVILDLAYFMKEKNILFSGRGFGRNYKCAKTPNGEIDDHSFMIDSHHVRTSGMYSDEPQHLKYVEGLVRAGLNSEGILFTLAQRVTPWEKIHVYSDMSECEVLPSKRKDPRYPDRIAHRTLPPVNLDRKRRFLHCDDLDHLDRIFKEFNIDHNLIVREL